ncbi:hypothetical protein QFC21_006875 [Naganishia friedmannii]|uniref:Uncharacterized protein n=1 Tax=Naganishia friedmannii TaxID=89922 RepID=A0ACC2UZW8_9TREE|nr:hypothetical protein QFC21_006875 [Naganishia friedmannii]
MGVLLTRNLTVTRIRPDRFQLPSDTSISHQLLTSTALRDAAKPQTIHMVVWSILFGYDLGVIANVIISPDFLKVTKLDSTKASDADYIGFIVSSFLLGAFCGCIPASLFADALSRRRAITIGACTFIVGGVLQCGANGRSMMMAGRFFAGLGVGQLSLLAPLYQSEIAHPSIRGRLTTLQQFCLGIGALIASIIAYELEKNHKGSVFQWRFPLGFQIAPAIPLALLIPLFPESPRWLMLKGRKEEALHNLARLHARGDINDQFVQAEYAELDAKVSAEAQISSGWVEVFRGPANLRRVFLGIILQFSVQMTGVSVIQYYAPDIFAAIGFSYEKTFLFQTINSVIALVAQALCILTVDKLGRRLPLISANLVSCACFAVATALQAKYPASVGNTSAGYAFVMMTWIYNFAFSYGIGPLSWAYPVEIMNTATRAKGTALTSMSCWIANFFIAQITPRAIKAIGWKYYICFSVMSFTNAVTIYLFFPPDYVGHGEEQLRRGELHVETGYEASGQKEKAEIEQQEDKEAY